MTKKCLPFFFRILRISPLEVHPRILPQIPPRIPLKISKNKVFRRLFENSWESWSASDGSPKKLKYFSRSLSNNFVISLSEVLYVDASWNLSEDFTENSFRGCFQGFFQIPIEGASNHSAMIFLIFFKFSYRISAIRGSLKF